ncbi:DNA starvation/stationary phase protection protein [Chitinophaga pendula]|uniref:Dps family protein n=1 Tax=Chitinophaga TaxID=79328 RepID=UPI000BAF1376|nr:MULTISPECIES: Dps family protein [Chitinophaga]ASZ09983.1 DNA starvation/stationary phase protection protein [Chitinophaga sp. MD30]UCJ07073.1 DNA starvation/stationary phase protection protein [Chitinophaga pendula]
MSTTTIGLEKKTSKELAEKLNVLLSAYQVFYMNTRGFHWNIKGDKFFTLHVKFEEIYTDALAKIDEIAERILTLGFTPTHTFSDYVSHSSIREIKNEGKDTACVQAIVAGLQTLIEIEREVSALSNEVGDDGTNDLITTYIREQEKLVWMYNAYLH